MFRAPCAHRQEVKIVLYSFWYHHTCKWPSRAHLCTGRPTTNWFCDVQIVLKLGPLPSITDLILFIFRANVIHKQVQHDRSLRSYSHVYISYFQLHRGRPKKNWMEGIRKAMNEGNLKEGQWEDRKQRRLGVGQRRKTFWNRYIHTYIFHYIESGWKFNPLKKFGCSILNI